MAQLAQTFDSCESQTHLKEVNRPIKFIHLLHEHPGGFFSHGLLNDNGLNFREIRIYAQKLLEEAPDIERIILGDENQLEWFLHCLTVSQVTDFLPMRVRKKALTDAAFTMQ